MPLLSCCHGIFCVNYVRVMLHHKSLHGCFVFCPPPLPPTTTLSPPFSSRLRDTMLDLSALPPETPSDRKGEPRREGEGSGVSADWLAGVAVLLGNCWAATWSTRSSSPSCRQLLESLPSTRESWSRHHANSGSLHGELLCACLCVCAH